MLRSINLLKNGPKNPYNRQQINMLTHSCCNLDKTHFVNPENLSPKLQQGLPLLQRLRKQYPDAETPPPSIYDKYEQASYNKLQDMVYSGQRGYSKLLQLEKQGRLFSYPVNSEKFNWFDEKIPEKEKEKLFLLKVKLKVK